MFEEQKKKALTDSSDAILILMNYLMTVVGDLESGHDEVDRQKLFKQFMQVYCKLMCMWCHMEHYLSLVCTCTNIIYSEL